MIKHYFVYREIQASPRPDPDVETYSGRVLEIKSVSDISLLIQFLVFKYVTTCAHCTVLSCWTSSASIGEILRQILYLF